MSTKPFIWEVICPEHGVLSKHATLKEAEFHRKQQKLAGCARVWIAKEAKRCEGHADVDPR